VLRWLIVLTLVLVAGTAGAQEPAPEPEPDPAAERLKQAEAKYAEGDYLGAIELLEQARALDPAPATFRLIGRAFEALGDLERAAEHYEEYVRRAPQASDRGEVEQRALNIRRRIALRKAIAEEPAPEPEPPMTEPVTERPVEGITPWPWVIAAVGASGVVAGAVMGVLAEDAHDDAVAEPSALAAEDLQGQAETLAAGANLAVILGGLATAIGAVWGIVELTRSEPEVTLGPGWVRGRF
jgi:tetratricopeptide (TPR) repeat protein